MRLISTTSLALSWLQAMFVVVRRLPLGDPDHHLSSSEEPGEGNIPNWCSTSTNSFMPMPLTIYPATCGRQVMKWDANTGKAKVKPMVLSIYRCRRSSTERRTDEGLQVVSNHKDNCDYMVRDGARNPLSILIVIGRVQLPGLHLRLLMSVNGSDSTWSSSCNVQARYQRKNVAPGKSPPLFPRARGSFWEDKCPAPSWKHSTSYPPNNPAGPSSRLQVFDQPNRRDVVQSFSPVIKSLTMMQSRLSSRMISAGPLLLSQRRELGESMTVSPRRKPVIGLARRWLSPWAKRASRECSQYRHVLPATKEES